MFVYKEFPSLAAVDESLGLTFKIPVKEDL